MSESIVMDNSFASMRDSHLLVFSYIGQYRSAYTDVVVKQADLAMETGKKVACIIIIGEHSATPDGDSRKQYAQTLRSLGRNSYGTAYVSQASGFRGAVQRSTITGMNMLFGSQMNIHVCAHEQQGLEWLSAQGIPAEEYARLKVLIGMANAALPQNSDLSGERPDTDT